MFSLPYMRGIIPIVGVMIIVALGAYTHYTLEQARYSNTGPIVISVAGEGEVVATPDIVTFSFSVSAEEDTAGAAQEASAEKINAILAYLREEGVEEKDIKTQNYNLNPRYEYTRAICDLGGNCPPGERVLRGYEVHQTVRVKVRDTDTAGDLVSGVGELGATNMSGISFTIDDESALMAEARAEAIRDAQEKALVLAEDLDVRIVRMTGFWEDQGGYPVYSSYGMGGDFREEASFDTKIAPELPSGENTITSRVNISYEVR